MKFEVSKFDQTFIDWINTKDIIICSASTSLYDCVLLNKKTIVIDNLSPERKKHGNLLLDDFDPIIKFLTRPKSINEVIRCVKKNNKINYSIGLKNLLANEVNYPDHDEAISKISNYLKNISKESKKFKFKNYVKEKIFLLNQNYIALKYFLKKFLDLKKLVRYFHLDL